MVVLSGVVFQYRTDPAEKLLPVTERLKEGPPATAELGVREVMEGPEAAMGKARDRDCRLLPLLTSVR
ncbi:MAG: hypothetical protein QM757_46890 [Paludibaculum sp.]